MKPGDAGQGDQEAPVIGFRKGRNASDTAGTMKTGAAGLLVLLRLDHADQPVSAERILCHRQIARLENIERELAAGQQQNPGQREDRNAGRHVL